MKITIPREALLQPLQAVSGIVEKRQTLPILANILLKVANSELTVIATDLEIEIQTSINIDAEEEITFTLSARKLIDICRALPDSALVTLEIGADKAILRSGNSRFSLGVLDANDYPAIEPSGDVVQLTLPETALKTLIEKTHFAMAQQDVRYYLNGMLFEMENGGIRTVATDGHRLATAHHEIDVQAGESKQIILPRKAVSELNKLLTHDDKLLTLEISKNHLRLHLGKTLFISKLIDGRFPDYQKVIPKSVSHIAVIDKVILKEALLRTAILSNEKYRGVRFQLSENRLDLLAHNPEQEEAEEFFEIDYQGNDLTISFNVSYLIDTLNVIDSNSVRIGFNDANSSSTIDDMDNQKTNYVIMPMRL